MNTVTSISLNGKDRYNLPSYVNPEQIELSVMINGDEKISTIYPRNPSLENFLKISREFLKRCEAGNVNQRK